jgi:hypothetical protein
VPKLVVSPEKVASTRTVLQNIPPAIPIHSDTAEYVAEHFTDIYRARRAGVGWEELIAKYFHGKKRKPPSLRMMLRIFRALCEQRGLPHQMERSPRMRDQRLEGQIHRTLTRNFDEIHKKHDLNGHVKWSDLIPEFFGREELQPPARLVDRIWRELRVERAEKKR